MPVGVPDGVPWARRAGDVAPDQVRAWRACADVTSLADMARGVVGADVLGGPRARGRP